VNLVEESALKWAEISHGMKSEMGVEGCYLCEVFYDDDCHGCPVAKEANDIFCDSTPYETWVNHIRREHYGHYRDLNGRSIQCPECQRIAIMEVLFLCSLGS